MEQTDTGNSLITLMKVAFNAPNNRTIVFTPVTDSTGIINFTYSLISKPTLDFFGGIDYTGKTLTDVLPDGQRQLEGLKAVMQTGISNTWLRYYEDLGEDNQWFEVTDALSGGHIVRIWENITLRHKAEIASQAVLTQKAERKYASLFNSISQGFCIIEVIFDENGHPYDYIFLDYNPAFERQTGLKDAKGKAIKDMNPHHEQHWFDLYGSIVKNRKPLYFEQEAVIINGWYEVSAFPLSDEIDNKVAVIFNDISERKQAEKQREQFNALLEEQVKERTAKLNDLNILLEQKNEELARSNKDLESFNYVASHDLQEPLRKIQTFLSLITQRKEDNDAVERYLEKVNASAERMSSLISDVLAYSRLSADDQFIKTDLNIILDNVITDYELLISDKGAVIKKDKLPVLQAVPLQMRQLFSNLLSNALKYNNGEPVITITCKIIEGKTKMAQIIFSDNGIGFNNQYRDQIFKLFQRLHGRGEYNGTGIGLSIVKKIIEHHNGTISAESAEGKGAAFIIGLPL